MDRRKALLIVAVVIAAMGTLLVFLYVRGADNRADERYDAVQVLRVVKPIAPGETVEAAQAAGKIETGTVPQKDLLPDALTGVDAIAGKTATAAVYPGEQLTSAKFGAAGVATGLTIPKGKIAISVNLSDPALLAGFVNPGDKIAIFMAGSGTRGTYSRLLLPNVPVIGAGTQTVAATTTTDPAAAPLPNTLLTLALTQAEAERVLFASQNGTLTLGLINTDSQVAASGGITSDNLFQ